MSSPTRRARAPRPSISSSPDDRHRMARSCARPTASPAGIAGAACLDAAADPFAQKWHPVAEHATLPPPQRDLRFLGSGSRIKRDGSMLTLRTGNTSPFGRKIRIAVTVLGLEREVAIEPASTLDPADPIRQQNPLGKVPVLILDDGAALYDSPVIL